MGALSRWARKSWADALDVYANVTTALGCMDSGDPTACLLAQPKDALLNVSDAYYGNATGHSLPHKEGLNQTQVGLN